MSVKNTYKKKASKGEVLKNTQPKDTNTIKSSNPKSSNLKGTIIETHVNKIKDNSIIDSNIKDQPKALSLKANTVKEPSIFKKLSDYFKFSFSELKKISFPKRQETVQTTIITVTIMLFFSILLALLDFVFRSLIWSLL